MVNTHRYVLLTLVAIGMVQRHVLSQPKAHRQRAKVGKKRKKKPFHTILANYDVHIAAGTFCFGLAMICYDLQQGKTTYRKALQKVLVDGVFSFQRQTPAALARQFGLDAHRTEIWINTQQVIKSEEGSLNDFEAKITPLLRACAMMADLSIIKEVVAQTAILDVEKANLQAMAKEGYGFGIDFDTAPSGNVQITIGEGSWEATRMFQRRVRVFEQEKMGEFTLADCPLVNIRTTITTNNVQWQAHTDRQTIPFDVTYALHFLDA